LTYVLGVDLGTTFSAAAIGRRDQISMFDLAGRSAAMPSVVYVGPDGLVLVGDSAERRSVGDADRVAREVKRRLGDPAPVLLGGVPYAPETVTAMLLRDILRLVTEREGGPPSKVCVTRPANWGAYRQEILAHTLEVAGIGGAMAVSEPEAAAAWHARRDQVPDGSVLAVYDLGGGTFDAALMRKVPDGFEMLAEPRGLEHVGGLNFDAALTRLVDEALDGELARLDPTDPSAVMTMGRLRADVVAAKEALSVDVTTSVPVLLPSGWREVRVTRVEFEERVRPLIETTIDVVHAMIADAGLQPSDVSKVLLVGGSSRIPLVAQVLEAELSVPTSREDHPKHVVALGAALLASRASAASGAPAPVAASPGAGAAPATDTPAATPSPAPGTPPASTPAAATPPASAPPAWVSPPAATPPAATPPAPPTPASATPASAPPSPWASVTPTPPATPPPSADPPTTVTPSVMPAPAATPPPPAAVPPAAAVPSTAPPVGAPGGDRTDPGSSPVLAATPTPGGPLPGPGAGTGAHLARPKGPTGWALVILTGPDGGRIIGLEEGRLALGREPGGDGVVLRDRHASRTHAFVDISGEQVRVTDAGSMNGTFVDGEAAQGEPVEAGQSLRFGTTVAVLVQRRDNPYEVSPTIAAPWLRSGGGAGGVGLVLPPPPAQGGGFGLLRRGRADGGGYRELLDELAPMARLRHRQAMTERRLALPSAAHALALPPSRRLRADDAFGGVTFGYAEQPSMLEIEVPDGLPRAYRDDVARFVAAYANDRDAPVAVALTEEPVVEVVAPAGVVELVVGQLMVQLALLHEPADLAVAFLADRQVEGWEWCGRLPHVAARDGGSLACPVDELIERLGQERLHRLCVVFTRGGAAGAERLVRYCADTRLPVIRFGTSLADGPVAATRFAVDGATGLGTLTRPDGSGWGEVGDVVPATLSAQAVAAVVGAA
jgi:molecular chaperone DnaK